MFKLKKVSGMRALACLLLMFTLLMGWTLAESTQEPAYMVQEVTDAAAVEAKLGAATKLGEDGWLLAAPKTLAEIEAAGLPLTAVRPVFQ